jgi:DNA replication protein DnaC
MPIHMPLEDQLQNPRYADLSFEERLGLLVDVEITRRTNDRVHRRIKSASFPLQATLEDLDLSAGRGLKRAQILELAQGEWVRRHLNVLVLGATGTGKTYLSCALGRTACEAEFTVRYVRTSRLLQSLELAQADGSYPQLLRSLARTTCLSSMTGCGTRSLAPRPKTCSKSSMTAMAAPPPWSPPRSR